MNCESLQCSSPPSEIVLDPIGELSTRFHGHFSDFATESFTAEADLQVQYCRVPKNGLPKNGQAGISPKNKNDPGWKMS